MVVAKAKPVIASLAMDFSYAPAQTSLIRGIKKAHPEKDGLCFVSPLVIEPFLLVFIN